MMKNKLYFSENINREPIPNCKGLIYRAHVNGFINKYGNYVYKETMILLKRKSCPGCLQCDWLKEELQEGLLNEVLPICDNIIDNQLYKLQVARRDWETGIVDEYDLEFVKYDEES
jgi:hypothetical protein